MATKTSSAPEYLEGRKFHKAVLVLNGVNAIAFLDITAATVILTAVSNQFAGSKIVAFAAPAQLIGATVGQALLGYLSDVWSRRTMLMVAISILLVASVMSCISHFLSTAELFVVARAFAGVATGSISNLVNIAQNDISPPGRRLKYQGIQGMSVALGSIVGTLAAAVLDEKIWWACYIIQVGFSLGGVLLIYQHVPPNAPGPTRVELKEKMKTVDWVGIGMFAVVLSSTLLLLCKSNSFHVRVKAGLGVFAAVTGIIFFLVESLRPVRGVRPLIPFDLFRNRTISVVIVQNICAGFAYYAFIFLLPTCLTVVRRWSLLKAAAAMIPYFAVHAIWTTCSALVIKWRQERGGKSYSGMFYFGYSMWVMVVCALGYDSTRELAHGRAVVIIAAFAGLGTGSVFQNSVMAITQQAPPEHKAMALSIRNVARFLGGAFGAAVNQVVLRETLSRDLPERLHWISRKSIYEVAMDRLGGDRVRVENAYARGAALGFYVMIVVLGLALLLNPLVRDQPKDEEEEDVEKWRNSDASESLL